MATQLRVLLIEDSESDALLITRELRRAGYDVAATRVETSEGMQAALAQGGWDIIICDYALPRFNSPAALSIAIAKTDLPFIVVSGTIGEETAVEMMRSGAHDYLMKNNLKRLGAAVDRELREAEVRRERKRGALQIERHLQRLAALREIDLAITSSLDLRVTLDVILDQVVSRLQVDAACLLLLNPRTQFLEYAAGRGFRGRGMMESRMRVGEGLAGQCALERRTVHHPYLPNEHKNLIRGAAMEAEGFVAYYGTPLVAKGLVLGVLEVFHRSQLEAETDWVDFLEALAGQAAIAIDNATLFDNLQRANLDLILAYDTTLEGWSRALDLRDKETEGHTQRVTELTLDLARAMGLRDEELVHVRRGAMLHDIGKMGIPDHILLKPGPLSDDEWVIMKKHPGYALDLLSPIAYLHPALDIPYAHHEKWDGTGYPRGLRGEQIPQTARIFAVIDVWDALRSDRPYRSAWSQDKALTYIREQAGKHFEPAVVMAFLKLLQQPTPVAVRAYLKQPRN
jgi:response regulator RpfG family c-di-GMP phosphodiesterase